MPADPKRVRELFFAAAELPAADRVRYLTDRCGDDADLRAAVDRLLVAYELPASVVDGSAPVIPTVDFPSISERPGTMIGPYKLMEQIGEGGFGLVFVAEQTHPVKRKLALKIIKPGMDSKQVIARFEAERQALALMDHPNIAHVLDAGATESGRPYFVMELVRGIPITDYCDQNQLTPSERLELFVSVCQAIQHAHQKGIIHRDIKPSNILVTSHDGKPVAKVIDFGVAKAIYQHLTERTIYTNFAQMIGTPLYMSPEQAEMSGLDIDTRSDIYSLGVLLYELLTGTTPLERQRFASAAYDEIRRVIREEEPPKPSQRLSTSDTLPSLAANRKTEPARLSRMFKGELDWIVMKALEKDRTRRYETANGLARDIQRYLADEVVEARPPSAGYRLKKFVRRHKGQVLAASLVLVALLAGIVGTTWGLIEARRQEQIARAETSEKEEARHAQAERAEGERLAKLDAQTRRTEAEKQQRRAEAGEKLAGERLVQVEAEKKKTEEEKQIAVAVKDFLQHKLLGQADVTEQSNALLKAGSLAAAKKDPTIRELLDRAAGELSEAKIEANFPNQPLLQAEILQTVGDTYRGVGEFERAIGFLQRALALRKARLGPEHSDTLYSMNNLASAFWAAGKLDRALPLIEETLKLMKAKVGPEDANTLTAMHNFAMATWAAEKLNRALPLLEETLALRKARLGPEHPDTLHSMHNLALAYQDAGKLDRALPLAEETLQLRKARLGPEHPETLASMNTLALAYQAAGKLDLAVPLFEETLKLTKAKLGPEHPDTLRSMNNLATAYCYSGKWELALPLLEETLKLLKAKLGPDHPTTLIAVNSLGVLYWTVGKRDLALPLYEETFKLRRAKLGPEHSDTLLSMNTLAMAYRDIGKLDRALPLFEETLKLRKAKLGPDHPDTVLSMNNLAVGYMTAGKQDLALPLFEETLKLMKAMRGPEHPSKLGTMNNLAMAYQAAGKLDLALPLFEDTLKFSKAKLGPNHPETLSTMINLASAYLAAGKLDRSKELLSQARKVLPKDSPQLAGPFALLGLSLLQAKAFTEAEPLLRECLAIREKTQPDLWTTFNTQSLLGGALLGQKKYAEAESLLLAGYEGMKQRQKSIPPQGATRIPEALDRLLDLYTAKSRPDEVKKWQAERAKYPAAAPMSPQKK